MNVSKSLPLRYSYSSCLPSFAPPRQQLLLDLPSTGCHCIEGQRHHYYASPEERDLDRTLVGGFYARSARTALVYLWTVIEDEGIGPDSKAIPRLHVLEKWRTVRTLELQM